MYSFYGGRPGNSFTIIASFSSVQAMIEAFKNGPNYTDVHYDEHVIINTENKNNPTNGQIYRRGYDYNNDMGGAELIGTIVGPAGKAPLLTMDEYNVIDNMQGTEGLIDNEDGYYISMKSKGQLTIANDELIPGKDEENNFHDTIKWVSYSFRDPEGRDTIAHVGFKIPYPVIDFEISSTDFWNSIETIRIDDKTHPFYEKWKINMPKGQKGDSIQNFRVITLDQNTNNIEDYKTAAEMADDRQYNREILVYDYYIYNDTQGNPIQTPQRKTFYIGDYNIINSIDINEEGTLTVSYTHNDNQIFQKMIKWIERVELKEDGTLSFKYNNQNEMVDLENKIKWITNLYLEPNGKLMASFNYGEDEEITTSISDENNEEEPIVLKWIKNIYLSPEGIITVYYNNEETEEINNSNPLKFINDIALTDNGILKVEYNVLKDFEDPEQGNVTEEINGENPIKWISKVNITDQNGENINVINQNIEQNNKGKLIINYNNGDSDTFNMRYPTNIEIDETLDTDHPENQYKIKTTYSDGTISHSESPINYIKKMLISSNGHLLAQYTNQNQNIGASTTINNVTQDWADLGIVSPEAFGFNNSTTTITNKYLTGLLVPSQIKNNYEDLTFSINVSQFLPKNLLSISITGCNITVYYSNNTSETILIDADHSYITSDKNIIISSNLFGIDFIFANFSNKSLSEKTLVNILINSLDLTFEFDNSTEEAQSEIHDLASLTRRVVTLETETNQLTNTTVPAISQDVSAINQIIPKSSISSYSTTNRTIISDLNKFNTVIGDISKLNISTTKGSTIVDSLTALATPLNNGLLSAWRVNLNNRLAAPSQISNTSGAILRSETTNGTVKGYQVLLIGDNIIDKQSLGYILQFSYFNADGYQTAGKGHYQYFFVPKALGMSSNPRSSIEIPLVQYDGTIKTKTIYIKTQNASSSIYNSFFANKKATFIQGAEKLGTYDGANGFGSIAARDQGNFALTAVYGV